MKVIRGEITRADLKEISSHYFKTLIKAVIDVEREIIALDAELHVDLEALLLEDGSKQENLWGINIYPDKTGEDFMEYSALINIKPSQNNASMDILDEGMRRRIEEIVKKWIDYGA